MSNRLYIAISGAIFLFVGILHLLRLVNHWPMVVGTFVVPHALSYFGFPAAIGYSLWAVWLLRRR
jgi:hypothetical protein